MIQVLSHRGLWLEPPEKNTRQAFEASFQAGFGVETDIRDLDGELVISHDPARKGCMTFEDFMGLVKARLPKNGAPLALNIKADGLAQMLAERMRQIDWPWFVFDMSVPDLVQHAKAGNPIFARVSEIETLVRHPALNDSIRGVWLDGFWGTWYSRETIRSFLEQGLQVCVVSPELHKRSRQEAQAFWDEIKPLANLDGLSLCTDWPRDAQLALHGRFDNLL